MMYSLTRVSFLTTFSENWFETAWLIACFFVFNFIFYPSQSNFSTLRKGLRNGTNLTPLSSGFGYCMSKFTARYMFLPMLVSVRCLKIWIGL